MEDSERRVLYFAQYVARYEYRNPVRWRPLYAWGGGSDPFRRRFLANKGSGCSGVAGTGIDNEEGKEEKRIKD